MTVETKVSPVDEQVDGAPVSAEESEDLFALARSLGELAPPPELTPEVADRILMKIESSLGEDLAPAPARSRFSLKERLSHAGAFLPGVFIQRRADAFAALLEDVEAGRSVTTRGRNAEMLRAAYALTPVPAVAMSPSVTDWLEVRLTSPALAPEQRRKVAEVLHGAFRSGAAQWGMAGAAAAMVAAAAINLAGPDVSRVPKTTPVAAPKTPVTAPLDAGQPEAPVAEAPVAGTRRGSVQAAPPGGDQEPKFNIPTPGPNPDPSPPEPDPQPMDTTTAAGTAAGNQQKVFGDFMRGLTVEVLE